MKAAAELQGRGYTVEPFLAAAEVAALLQLHREHCPVVPSDYYVTAFSDDVAGKRRMFEGIREVVQNKVATLAPGCRLLMGSFVTKRARSTQGRLGLHQDYSLVDHTRHVGLNAWIPLCDVDQRNGCLKVIEGSHRFGHISACPPNASRYDSVREKIEAEWMVDRPMRAGEAFLFDVRLLHATENNSTDADRTAVLLNLVPENAAALFYHWNHKQPCELEVFEIDSEFLLQLPPNQYLADPTQLGARLVGRQTYDCAPTTLAELDRLRRTETEGGEQPRGVLERLRSWLG